MINWYNASGGTDSDADELAFLIVSLSEAVNPRAINGVGQRWYDNRVRLLWLRLWLPLRLRLRRCPGLSLCHLLFLSTSLEFQFKILAAEKGIEFLIPEFMSACAVIQIRFP